ncbi:unnamed protein product [Heligmosomoides polygyrus]|uniref:Histone-lysine N-methyltransferase SETMAR n=1 Tax=Heligmosomoides polygyrus TaxID=6339 RepID=A0A183FUB5_HELPZ|nr:unnamed protein product [Heligmosomoides polygyrus]
MTGDRYQGCGEKVELQPRDVGPPHATLDRLLRELGKVARKCHFEWLRNVIKRDEKAVFLVNHSGREKRVSVEKDAEPDVKRKVHGKKVVYWGLLRHDFTVAADIYTIQLERIKAALDRKREKAFPSTRQHPPACCFPDVQQIG